jgi:hypothetical protein
MDTIRLTGPGLITKIVSEYFCIESNGSEQADDLCSGSTVSTEVIDNNSMIKISENVTIFPYYFFNPVPNSYTTELSDENKMIDLKLKYVVSNSLEIDSNKLTNETIESEKGKCDGNGCRTDTIVCTYAVHWWQRSWQENEG